MNIRRGIIFIFLMAVILTTGASAQVEQKSSPGEKKEVLALVKRFNRRLTQTRDIAPLLNELFVPGGVNRFLTWKEAFDSFGDLKLTRRDKFRLYALSFNFLYLTQLSELSCPNDPGCVSGNEENNKFEIILPRAMGLGLTRDWESFIGDIEGKIRSLKEFRSELSRIERRLAAAQQYLRDHPVERSKTFRGRALELEDVCHKIEHFRAEEFKGGFYDTRLPGATRLLSVETPFFFIILTKQKGKLRILTLMFPSN